MSPPSSGKTAFGLDPNVAAGLAVVLHWIGGLVFYLAEKDSPFVRFYALQSISLDVLNVIAVIIAGILSVTRHVLHLPFTFVVGSEVVSVVFLVFWIILIVNAFSGKIYELPLIGKWCRQQAGL